MKGAVYLGDSELEVRDFPRPKPDQNEVLVEMRSAGLCGSDLHKYHNDREWAKERNGMISGHEPAGVVSELGPGVDNVSLGDRVSVYHSLGCGYCYWCNSGTPVFCENEGAFGRTRDGCHADYMTAPARFCLPLPANHSFAVGAMLGCTVGTAYSSLMKLSMGHGQYLVIFGLGPIGLTAMLLGSAMGYKCVGVELNPYRIEHARKLCGSKCGSLVIDGEAVDPVEAIREATNGRGAMGVVECSGSAVARKHTVDVAAIHATIVIVGAGDELVTFDHRRFLKKELTMRANSVFSVRTYFDCLEFLGSHEVPLDDMVTHTYSIDEAPRAFKEFDTGNTGKVVFEWK